MASQPLRKRIKYTALYLFVRFLIFAAKLVPRKPWLWTAGQIGKLAYYLMPSFRKMTIANLNLAFNSEKSPAEIVNLSKEVYTMIGKNAGDTLRASNAKTLKRINKFMITEGIENFRTAHAKGKGVILLTCHLGAFDLQVPNFAMRGVKALIINTPLKDKRLDKLLYAHRNAYEGGKTVERGKEIFQLMRVLKQGEAVAILIDQDTRVKSRFVNFFGMPAATPVGAAILALKTGAAVVPSYIYLGKDNKQHHCILPEMPLTISGDEEKDIVENTQTFTSFVEAQVRKHPDQWVWMHERWKTKPGEEMV